MSRVLIVEDDPAIRCGLKDNLELESHQVLTAADGEAGYRLLCEQAPDLVVLDLMLPKLSGDELCRRARAAGFTAPILMLSARSEESDRVSGLDLGANDYVSKPFSLRELLARVRALLRHEREHRLDERRLTSELQTAARVQRDLFPRVLLETPGLDYAGLCLPARGVSGDCYDFLPLENGRIGLLLADVSGKGMPAALLGAALHAAVRENARLAGLSCGDVLARVNRLLFETTAAERFATVFYAVYDPTARSLTYANAGHPPPILVRDGRCMRLDSLTPPVGLLPTMQPSEATLPVVAGDRLLVFSDGASDASGEMSDAFGDDRLLDVLRSAEHETAAGTCEAVLHAIRSYLGDAPPPDDITVIAVKVL